MGLVEGLRVKPGILCPLHVEGSSNAKMGVSVVKHCCAWGGELLLLHFGAEPMSPTCGLWSRLLM